MMMKPTALMIALTATLAGCVAPMPPAPVVDPVPAMDAAPMPVAGVAGLESREPDVCKSAPYKSAVGQPASVIPTLGVTRKYRIVEYRGIEPEEYDPTRVVFRLNAQGIIEAVSCG